MADIGEVADLGGVVEIERLRGMGDGAEDIFESEEIPQNLVEYIEKL